MASLADLRREYTLNGLRKGDLHPDPIEQFRLWLDQAMAAELIDANAMALSTADATGTPSCRIVLLKGFDARGFLFFTNYESPKGRDLEQNPQAALLFFWPPLERQIRINGDAARISRDESAAYFRSRPRESQIGANISRQGEVIDSRADLELLHTEAERKYAGGEVPLPPAWGGYRVAPKVIEFWQGRAGRLHDRLRYRRANDTWIIERLCP